MDLTFLNEFCIPVIVGICVCVGYVIKTSIPTIPNRFIPLIMAVLGLLLNIWISHGVDANIILAGLFSGLSSTGLHQLFKTLVNTQEER